MGDEFPALLCITFIYGFGMSDGVARCWVVINCDFLGVRDWDSLGIWGMVLMKDMYMAMNVAV